ncbi:hypothetical protein BGZ46_006317 [Entomortierella lignicola]|nr:hypothetical protein BGZ46_006317 [Entomortierella lignicola]
MGATLHDNQSSNQGRYSAPAPPLPYAPRYSSVHTLPHRNHDSRASTSVTGYLSTSPMQDPRSPSFDYSQPPMSPLPPYIARPPPAMQPPRYYQEIHQEIQGSNQMRPMAIDDRTDGYGYESERTPGRGNIKRESVIWCLKASQSDATYNQDVNDIHSYYIKRHHATVIVLELQGDSTLNDVGSYCPYQQKMFTGPVSSQHRGKGYAKAIIEYLVNVAKEQQFDRILVETETAWASAVQIYKSVGFQVAEAGEEIVHYEYRL